MKDKLEAIREKLESLAESLATPRNLAYATGAAAGSTATILYVMMKYGPAHTLVVDRAALNALVNDETNFIRFTSSRTDHVFRVSLEH
jgi:hypothetical protein